MGMGGERPDGLSEPLEVVSGAPIFALHFRTQMRAVAQ